MKKSVVCVIPASTINKNERRFKKFCEKLSTQTRLKNGFAYISITVDREDLKVIQV